MMKTDVAKNVQAYRERLSAAGEQEVQFRLRNATIDVIDDLKQRLGLRNRGQVVEQLVHVIHDLRQRYGLPDRGQLVEQLIHRQEATRPRGSSST